MRVRGRACVREARGRRRRDGPRVLSRHLTHPVHPVAQPASHGLAVEWGVRLCVRALGLATRGSREGGAPRWNESVKGKSLSHSHSAFHRAQQAPPPRTTHTHTMAPKAANKQAKAEAAKKNKATAKVCC